MSSSLSKIHVTNSTGLSLNERFTAISSQPRVQTNIVNARRSRSRSRSIQRSVPAVAVERVSSRANQRLLAQLQRKHKVQAALKLKRRSMRTVGGAARGNGARGYGANGRIQRGSVKAFRVGANGKPIKANSLTNIATMKADREMLNPRRPLRRSNSSGNIANRLGPRRPVAGGAAQRIARRNVERQRNGRRNSIGANGGRSAAAQNNRGRSRSRSRTRTQQFPAANGRNRSRTRNPENLNANVRGRSRSRNRNDNIAQTANNRRGRSRSRSRGRVGVIDKSSLPIKARLGVRPGMQNVRAGGNRGGGPNNRRGNDNRRRNASLTRRGVQAGRVQKRHNSTNQNVARAAGGNDGRNRIRSRSAVRNGAGAAIRSRSRTRKGQVGQQRQQGSGQARQQQRNNRAPRGRSQQRRGGNNNGARGGGRPNPTNNGKAQTQQRRGRSRSRTGRGASGPRNQGNKSAAAKPTVNKDDLDKELDQYMATTKTEHDMDYLLKN